MREGFEKSSDWFASHSLTWSTEHARCSERWQCIQNSSHLIQVQSICVVVFILCHGCRWPFPGSARLCRHAASGCLESTSVARAYEPPMLVPTRLSCPVTPRGTRHSAMLVWIPQPEATSSVESADDFTIHRNQRRPNLLLQDCASSLCWPFKQRATQSASLLVRSAILRLALLPFVILSLILCVTEVAGLLAPCRLKNQISV